MSLDSKNLILIMPRSILAFSLVLFVCLALAEGLSSAQQPVPVRNADGSVTVTHPDGSAITTGIPDETYGSDGTRDEEKDSRGRLVRTVYKDSKGRVLVSVYVTYGLGLGYGRYGLSEEMGKEMIAKTYHRAPDGAATGSSETVSKTGLNDSEISTETRLYDEKDKQTGGTKTEVDPDGKKRTYRWDPNPGVYVEVAAGETPATQPDPSVTVTNPDGSRTVRHSDKSRTTTGIPNTTYGRGGTMDEELDEKAWVRERSWKDRHGTTLEDEFTYYNAGGGKSVVKTMYNPRPGGGVRRGRQTTTTTNADGDEISTETVTYTDGTETSRTKTETDRKGQKRTYRWHPQKGYVEEAANVTPQTSGPGESSSVRGFAVASEVALGLNTTTFVTPRGKIRVNLPDDMAAGDTLSGTVSAEPQGKDDRERAANQGELNGYVVELEKQEASSTSRILKSAIPIASGSTYLILRDKDRKEVAKIEVPLAQQSPPVEKFDLPAMGQQGRAIEVTGGFDGDSSTTNVKVGGEDLEVLAESPRKVVARNSDKKIGPTELAVEERGQIVKREFHSVGIKLSAPKLNLLKGEQTTLTVTVHGLEGIREDVPLVLENKSVDVIAMGEQNLERIIISPSQAQGGSYTINRQLTGIQRGAFTITGTVTTRNRGSNQPLSSTSNDR